MKRFTALLLVLVMTAALLGCQTQELLCPGNFYYFRAETAYTGINGVIAPEQRELAGIEKDLNAILELYCAGPENREFDNPLPKGCPAPTYTLDGSALQLSFGAEFAELTGIELTVAAGCLARTFLELTGAETLILTADGALLNGETAMVVTLADLQLRDDSQDRLHGDYTIYYTGTDQRYLVGHSVSVGLSAREELPGQLLELMTAAPSGTGLRSVLPEGCRILSVTMEDGLCTVDLSEEFETHRFYSHTGQLLSLMGVVNTLTNLPEIEQVEFTIEGDLLVRYGALSVSGPLWHDERFLGPVRTALGEWDATIFLAHGEQTGLIPLPTRLRQTGALPQAEMMMRVLLSDSGLNGLSTCIPEGTQLNSLKLQKRVCHVDLSAQYLEKPENLLWAGRVIAASLCTLDGISAVRITVDGTVPAGFDGALFGVLAPRNDWFL
ncbi:MAG: hypothetical protein E7451_03370 [Ruminococcaceae bacterium]|nr:hypothetical protein [Oscillospiraceae bacterium]